MTGGAGLLEAVREAGFIYWGLFLAFGLILVAYLVWMRKAERADDRGRRDGRSSDESGDGSEEGRGAP